MSNALVNIRYSFSYLDFSISLYQKSQYVTVVPENAEIGTSIATVSARDGDWGRFGEVSYSLVGDAALGLFSVDARSGEITSVAAFDRERRDEYHFTVMAQVLRGVTNIILIAFKQYQVFFLGKIRTPLLLCSLL